MILKVLRSEEAKRFPMIGTKKAGDVGIDLPCILKEDMTIMPGDRFLIPTGIKLEIPEGYWASIEARSSTSKQSLIVPKGIIDEGYRGELFAQIINVGNSPVIIHDGDRLVQLLIHKREIKDLTIWEVNNISPSERGETGFGSTGQSAISK